MVAAAYLRRYTGRKVKDGVVSESAFVEPTGEDLSFTACAGLWDDNALGDYQTSWKIPASGNIPGVIEMFNGCFPAAGLSCPEPEPVAGEPYGELHCALAPPDETQRMALADEATKGLADGARHLPYVRAK